MAQGETRSLQQIKRETEATRVGLTSTVNQLQRTVTDAATEIRDRLRPDAIKAEVSGYIQSRGEQLLSDVKEAVRRNPMQAVAVGASVAYPVFRMARAIPVPILMIGAGLFFAGSKTGRDLTQQASDVTNDLADKTRQRAQDFGDQVSQTATAARDVASDAFNRTADIAADGREKFAQMGSRAAEIARARIKPNLHVVGDATTAAADAVSSGISDLKDRAAGIAADASSSFKEKVSGTASAISQSATDAKQAGQELLNNARDRVADVGQRASQTMTDTIAHNPLLVASVGLLLGGLVASALPKFQAEDALLGGAATALKKSAQKVAAQGLESAKDAAGEIIGNVAQQAKAEGLTPEGFSRGAEDVRQRIQRVAERAVNTTFESAPKTNGQEKGGHNG